MGKLTFTHKTITIYSRLGFGNIVGQNQTCEQTSTDINTSTDFYLRLGSWKQNTINWIVYLPTTLSAPATVTIEPPINVTIEVPTTVTTEVPTNLVMQPEAVIIQKQQMIPQAKCPVL